MSSSHIWFFALKNNVFNFNNNNVLSSLISIYLLLLIYLRIWIIGIESNKKQIPNQYYLTR